MGEGTSGRRGGRGRRGATGGTPEAGPEPEVVVVGAGPVGLALALGLARAGRRVLVLEKEAGTAEHSRAPAVWPRTQEILAALGVLDRFLAEGVVLGRLALHDVDTGRVPLAFPLEELRGETDHPHLLVLPQATTERLLTEALREEATAELLFSAEVVDLRQEDGHVRVAFRHEGTARHVEVPFVAGCDGASSTVRDLLGLPFEGKTYEARAALADVELPGWDDAPFPRFSTEEGMAVGIRIDAGLWRLILPFGGADATPLDARVTRALGRLFPELAGPAPPTVWQSSFRLHRRIAPTFVVGRIALAGDAAHVNSPVGGQGMNAGIQDADDLARTLPLALDAGDAGALDGYDRRRRGAVEGGVNPFTDRLTRAVFLGRGRLFRAVLRVASLALRFGPVRRQALRRIAMLDAGRPPVLSPAVDESPAP